MVEENKKANHNNTESLNMMSNNIVDVMSALAKNVGIRTLLYVDEDMPFLEKYKADIPTSRQILSPSSEKRRISPVSFDMNAKEFDRSEIRVYYNIGRFDKSGKWVDYNMHIDIICAKELWMISDHVKQKSLIRPYEIMSRIFDEIGSNNANDLNIGNPVQFQMLSVNERFDAIRIYYNTRDVMGNTDYVKQSKA